MKGLNKAAVIITKVIEIVHWIATGLVAAAGICAAVAPKYLGMFMDVESLNADPEISCYGFGVNLANSNGQPDMLAFALYSIGATAIFVIMALIFRNLHIIFENAGKSVYFSEENLKRVKRIGFFSIAIPVVGFVMGTVIGLAVGIDTVETSNSMDGFIMGIIILCLTQFFARGAELEKDVDGLV